MKRILVVEDSRTQAERLRILLSQEGYDVAVALTGEDGLLETKQRSPDLIISDVTMPKMDGFTLCQTLKSSETTNWIPIILLTSRTSPADIIKGLEAGADNFIPKPYEDGYLLGRVRRIFEQLELRKEASLDMEVLLSFGGRRIRVTADRQQIIELLFSTFEQMSKNFDELAQANQELQEARVEAERANRAKSQFLSRMSHELRTPLNSIIGFAQILELTDLPSQDQESVQTIVSAGRHLLDLINELLDIGRIEADELTLSIEPVRVAEVHDEVVQFMQPQATQSRVGIRSTAGPTELHAMADRQRLRQVLLNLLSNAVKYNQEGGSVRLGWSAVDDRLRIEVADTGIGIEREHLARLFVPFDRIASETTIGVEGTGLGLAVSKRLVEMMGGSLTVESELGVGTTFWVELPLAEAEPRGRNDDRPPEPVVGASYAPVGGGTILYIEDDLSSFRLVQRILQQHLGVTTLHTTRGREGLDLARRHDPRVILLDVNLPDIVGDEVVRTLRSDPETRDVPVIVLSADADKGQPERLRQAGANDFILKPIDLHGLVRAVEKHLRNQGQSTGNDDPDPHPSMGFEPATDGS
jgi:signal transduction histidine kinase